MYIVSTGRPPLLPGARCRQTHATAGAGTTALSSDHEGALRARARRSRRRFKYFELLRVLRVCRVAAFVVIFFLRLPPRLMLRARRHPDAWDSGSLPPTSRAEYSGSSTPRRGTTSPEI